MSVSYLHLSLYSFPTRRSSDLGARRAPFVHRLVLMAFVGPPPEGTEGCHNDGDASNKDRKSTRLNSSHVAISYAVFCLKKKKIIRPLTSFLYGGKFCEIHITKD